MIEQITRLPAAAGTFYEGEASLLRRRLDDCRRRLDGSGGVERELQAVVLPHAGYAYSLPVALRTLIEGEKFPPREVLVLGPSHHCGFRGAAFSGATSWRTPLGELPVLRPELPESGLLSVNDAAHLPEHSIEVILPMLQYLWGNPTIIPVLVGSLSLEDALELGRIFSAFVKPGTLIAVSSDFTHYGRGFDYTPNGDTVSEEDIRKIDLPAAEMIAGRDLRGFAAYLGKTGATICGMNPIAVLLAALDAAGSSVRGRIVAQCDSGTLTGDRAHVVDYIGIAFA